MIEKYLSGKAATIGQSFIYPLPIPLDPAPYIGSVVAGISATENINLYFSDGVEWRQNIAESTITELIEVLISEITLQGYAEEDLPDPTAPENERRLAFNETKGLPGFVWEDEWRYLTDEARVAEIAENAFQVIQESIEYTIGAAGDFASISDALAAISKGYPAYEPNWAEVDTLTVTLRILSGHVVSEQIFVQGQDFGFVNIISDDPVVMVAAAGLLIATPKGGERDHVLFRVEAGTFPIILGVIFEFDGGVVPVDPSYLGGIYTPVPTAVRANEDSFFSALYRRGVLEGEALSRRFGFDKFGLGVLAGSLAKVTVGGGQILDAGITAIRAQAGAEILITSVETPGYGISGIQAAGASRISVVNAGSVSAAIGLATTTFQQSLGVDAPSDIVVSGGSEIVLTGNNILGGLSQAPNILSTNGLISGTNQPAAYGLLGAVIADNAVATITPPRLGGFLMITVANGTTYNPAAQGIVAYSCGAALSVSELSFTGIGTSLAVTTGTLTGTTGADGDLTVSARSGDIQIENRLGGTRTISVSWM